MLVWMQYMYWVHTENTFLIIRNSLNFRIKTFISGHGLR